jgi:hypothetical protein
MKELGIKSEDEIVGILKQKVFGSDSYNQSEQAKQRQDSMNMYYLNPLGNENEGTSSIQSSDVFDAVEGTKAVIHEALTSGRELTYFEPLDEDDVDTSKMANRYVKDRFIENNGYRFLIDALHDGLLAKNAVCKYYWLEDEEERYEPFVGLNPVQFQGMVNQPNIDVVEVQAVESVGPDGIPYQVFSGQILITTDKSKVAFDLIKPEDFFGDETSGSDADFTFASDRYIPRKGELIEDYPHLEKEIQDAPMYWDSRREQDNLVRRSNDDSWRTDSQNEKAWERDPVEVHDCYIYLWGAQGYGIYRYKMLAQRYILWEWPTDDQGNELEELPEDFEPEIGELVDEIPYLVWSPYPLSHRWDGLSQADQVRDIQLTATNLKRSMIDHTLRTNNPMREANLEFIRNPQDLIDNVIGAVIDKEMAAGPAPVVTPVAQPQMSPVAFNTLEMVRQESEQRSSYSRVAGGINQGAISNQNSTDMIQKLTDSSNRRIMMMTRNYVELFLKKLYVKIYQLGVQNDKNAYKVELNGNWVDLSPSQWPERPDMRIVNAMTPEAALASAMGKMQMHQLLSADPDAMLMYEDKKRFNMYSEIFRDMGENAIDRFISNPDSDEYKKAQTHMLQQQQQQAQEQGQMAQDAKEYQERQIKILEMQTQANIDQGQQKIDNDAYEAADKQSLSEDEFEHKQDLDEAEIILETRKINEGVTSSGVSVG